MSQESSPFTPHGKRVLLTGSCQGIGLAAAESLASAGCDVVINHIASRDKARMAADRIAEKYGVSTHVIEADVGKAGEARKFVRQAAELLGGLDIIVSNAGICHFKPFLELTDEEWTRHVDVNFNGAFYVAQEGAKILVEQGLGGRIIFTTSVGAFRSNATQTHYCATKGGLHVLMQGMALELGPHGITVNGVAPGWIHTDINDASSRDPAIAEPWIKAHAPVGRLGDVKDLRGAYLFLASRESAYINGATITVDGGWLAQL